MVKELILNNSNYVAGSNNLFIYTLTLSTKFTNKSKIGIASLAEFNSTFNISSSYGNNKLTFFSNASTSVTCNWTFSDCYYSAADLNFWL